LTAPLPQGDRATRPSPTDVLFDVLEFVSERDVVRSPEQYELIAELGIPIPPRIFEL
jgi:hypothetical protein